MSLLFSPAHIHLRKARAAADPLTIAVDTAVPRAQRWWRATWQAFQAGLPERWTLRSLEAILREAWQTYALRRFEHLQAILQRLAQAVTSPTLPALPTSVLGITQAIEAIEASLGQVPTTMARVPQVLLPEVAVLTIPQQGALARMAEGLAQEVTLTPAHVERTLRTQARAQLETRVTTLAQEQAWTAAQAGQQAGWQQQGQAGTLGAGARRYWRLGANPCPRCAPIPGMNSGGVGLSEPFSTPDGPRLSPGLHVNCRCSVSLGGPF